MEDVNHTQAIVLKVLHTRLILLSQQHGKIIVGTAGIERSMRLSPGMLIGCTIKPYRSGFFMQDLDIVKLPVFTCHQSMLFFHHLFELVHNFFPSGIVTGDLYLFIRNLIIASGGIGLLNEHKSVFFKACIGGLFIFTGSHYPSTEHEQALLGVKRIITATVDISWERAIDSLKVYLCDLMEHNNVSLDAWIDACVQSHPRAKFFRTGEVVYQLEKAPSDKVLE